jgi:diguanylate cyclase (GGDEF)-like protein
VHDFFITIVSASFTRIPFPVHSLDLRTIVLMTTITGAAMSIVLFSAYRSFPSGVRGLGSWALGTLAIGLAALLFGLREILPDWLSILGASCAMFWGVGLWCVGTQKFYDRRPSWWLFHLTWAIGMAAMTWWSLVTPSFAARATAFSFIVFVFYSLQASTILRLGERHFSTYFFGALMSVQAIMVLTRGVVSLNYHEAATGMFDGNMFHTVYLATSSFMMSLLPVGFMTVATRRLQTLLEERSNLDPLTGVLNRRGFAASYSSEKVRLSRNGLAMALMSIDLDLFKSINDRFGHGVGDRVLTHAADKIGKALRATDHVARFGGEEFVVLLPETSLERSLLVAARIQTSLRDAITIGLPAYTISIGISSQASPDEILEDVLSRADAALYRAKANGRNRIEMTEQAAEAEPRAA